MFHSAFFVSFFVASWQPTLSAAFSWHLTTSPKQCSNLSISIVGSDGQPPYRVLVVPTGPTPLANNVDVRAVIDKAFDGNSTTLSFLLDYPANSHFVAVVSDATGFGRGGASVETNVEDSNDAGCFDASKSWIPPFTYAVGTDNQIAQCQPTRVWWNGSLPHGTPTFVGVIPGGQSFELPKGSITDVLTEGRGFLWVPNVRGGTPLLVVGGDDRGMGTAGSAEFTVRPASDTSCLSNLSPSSTAGSPAGSFATDAVASNANSSGSTTSDGGLNAGVIVGAAVGGVIGAMTLVTLVILSYHCLRKDGRRTRRLRKRGHGPSIDEPFSPAARVTRQPTIWSDPLAQYNPEPFALPDSPSDGYNSYYGNGYMGMAPGTASVTDPRSRYTSTTSASGVGMSDASRPADPRYGHPAPGTNFQPRSRLPSITSGSGGSAYDSHIGSGYGAPSVISSSSQPMHAMVPSAAQYENMGPNQPPPAFSPSQRVQRPPRGDIKHKVTNA